MNKLILLWIGIPVITISALSALILSNNAQAQVNPNDRFFEKNFCSSENNLLSDILYTNNEELSYDSTGCPVSTKIIHKWNELSIANKNLIINCMTLNGYTDVTPTIQ